MIEPSPVTVSSHPRDTRTLAGLSRADRLAAVMADVEERLEREAEQQERSA